MQNDSITEMMHKTLNKRNGFKEEKFEIKKLKDESNKDKVNLKVHKRWKICTKESQMAVI